MRRLKAALGVLSSLLLLMILIEIGDDASRAFMDCLIDWDSFALGVFATVIAGLLFVSGWFFIADYLRLKGKL